MMRSFIAAFITMFAFSISCTAEQFGAIITAADNSVVVSTSPGSSWQKAQKGMKLSAGAALKTAPRSNAELVYDDGTAMRIESNAHVSIDRAEKKGKISEYLISLFNGRVLNNVSRNKRKKRFIVRSPVSVIAVRGTVFVIDASTTTSTVGVYEGTVEARSVDERFKETVQVASNKQMRIDAGLVPGQAQPLEAEFEAYRKSVAELFEHRINWYRSHMEEVRKMNQDYMDSWRKDQEKTMEDFRNQFKDEKEDQENREKQQEFERDMDSWKK